jgi:hypothetical protein
MSTLPPINPAFEPASIRNGNAQAKKAYQEALGFEDVLVQQLTQELASSVSSPGGDSESDSSGGTGGMLGSDSSTNAFASMIPTTLTSSIMSSGGLGVAMQLARSIDPAIGTPQGSASSASTAGATS